MGAPTACKTWGSKKSTTATWKNLQIIISYGKKYQRMSTCSILQLSFSSAEFSAFHKKVILQSLWTSSTPLTGEQSNWRVKCSDGLPKAWRKHGGSGLEGPGRRILCNKLLIQLTLGVLCLEGIPSSIAMASLSCFSIV